MEKETLQTNTLSFNLSDNQLRKLAKKVCNGHQHAMRYNNMLNACFKMGKIILEELNKQNTKQT